MIQKLINWFLLPSECFKSDKTVVKDNKILSTETTHYYSEYYDSETISLKIKRRFLKLTIEDTDKFILNGVMVKTITEQDEKFCLGHFFAIPLLNRNFLIAYRLVNARNDGIEIADIAGYYWIDKRLKLDDLKDENADFFKHDKDSNDLKYLFKEEI